MSEKKLKFGDVVVNKKEFHVSKIPKFYRHRQNSSI